MPKRKRTQHQENKKNLKKTKNNFTTSSLQYKDLFETYEYVFEIYSYLSPKHIIQHLRVSKKYNEILLKAAKSMNYVNLTELKMEEDIFGNLTNITKMYGRIFNNKNAHFFLPIDLYPVYDAEDYIKEIVKKNSCCYDPLYLLKIYLPRLLHKFRLFNACIEDDEEYVKTEIESIISYHEKIFKEDTKKLKEFYMFVSEKTEYAINFIIKTNILAEKENCLKIVGHQYENLNYVNPDFKKDKEIVLAAVKNNGSALEYADDSLKNDREIVLTAVKKVGMSLQFASENLKKDKEIALAAVENNGQSLLYVHSELKKDIEIVSTAIKECAYALKHADEKFRNDENIVFSAVSVLGSSLEFAGDIVKKNKKIVLKAIEEWPLALKHADISMRKNRDVVLFAARKNIKTVKFADISLNNDIELLSLIYNKYLPEKFLWSWGVGDELRKDKKFYENVIEINGNLLLTADESIKKNKEIVLKAFKDENAGFGFNQVDKSLRKDIDVIKASLLNCGRNLRYLDDEFKKNEEIVTLAIKNDGFALKYADEKLKSRKDFMLKAVQASGEYVQHLSLSKMDENDKREIFLAAVKQEPYALVHADIFYNQKLNNDLEIVFAAVSKDGTSLRFASENMRKEYDVVLTAVKQNGISLEYADTSLRDNYDIVLTAVKQDGTSLRYASNSLKKNLTIVGNAIIQNIKSYEYIGDDLKSDLGLCRFVITKDYNMYDDFPFCIQTNYEFKNYYIFKYDEENERLMDEESRLMDKMDEESRLMDKMYEESRLMDKESQ